MSLSSTTAKCYGCLRPSTSLPASSTSSSSPLMNKCVQWFLDRGHSTRTRWDGGRGRGVRFHPIRSLRGRRGGGKSWVHFSRSDQKCDCPPPLPPERVAREEWLESNSLLIILLKSLPNFNSNSQVVISYLGNKRQAELNDYSESGIWDIMEVPGQLIHQKSKISYQIRIRRSSASLIPSTDHLSLTHFLYWSKLSLYLLYRNLDHSLILFWSLIFTLLLYRMIIRSLYNSFPSSDHFLFISYRFPFPAKPSSTP